MKLYQGQPGTSDTLLFTAERRYTHLTITATNTTSSDATITLNVCYQGEAAATTNRILSAAVVPANKAGLMELGLVLEAGDAIRGLNGTSGAVTVLIDGLNIEQDSHSRGSSFSFFPPAATVINTGGGGTSPLTTKGDVWGFDTVDNRIPVGADDEVLTADSGAALGVSWQTPTAGGTNYWTYNAGTHILSPDAATTTPLTGFTVTATTTISFAAPTVTVGATGSSGQANFQAGTVGVTDFARVRAAAGSGAGVTVYANESGNTSDLTAVFFSNPAGSGSECGLSFFIPSAGGAKGPIIEMGEVPAAPGAPGSNYGRIYMRDNGAGKTQFVARFPTGAVQVICTEP